MRARQSAHVKVAVLAMLAACGGKDSFQPSPIQPEAKLAQQVATPTFIPGSGTYSSAVTVTLSDATDHAAIYYSTDGTDPGKTSTTSALYSGPITITSSTTIKAIATRNGFSDSAIASATYTIASATPTAYTVGGTISGLSGTVVLQDNGSADLTATADGSFTFATAIADGAGYSVTVSTQPSGQTCTVVNGAGTISGSNVTDVAVSCSATSPSTGEPIIYGEVNHISLSGTVRSTANEPLAGVTIQFNYYTSVSGPHEVYATTDTEGHYAVEFDTTPDTRWGVAFAEIFSFSAYELDARYVKVPTQQATFDFTLCPAEYIAVGGSVSLTLRPTDPICVNNVMDMHPWDPDYTCHRLRVLAPSNGTLTVQMAPDTSPIADLRLVLDGPDFRYGSFTLSLPVTAGDVVYIDPAMSWDATADQSITITTSM